MKNETKKIAKAVIKEAVKLDKKEAKKEDCFFRHN